MRKHSMLVAFLLCGAVLLLTACSHEHIWKEATCTEPATCEKCGETDGEPLGHQWIEATCAEPKTCSACGETEGEALGHCWVDATCTKPKTCSVGGETEGKKLGHDWAEATHESPKTCKRCGETRGEPLLFEVPSGLTTDYRFGEFDTFNSHASDNGLVDTMIWFNGTYEAVSSLELSDVKQGLQAYIATAVDEDGNSWLIELDLNEFGPIDKYADLANHRLCILGRYEGYSDVYEMPAVLVEKIFDRTTGNMLFSTWFTEA